MNLILWRHAEAEDGFPDHDRALTDRGRQQAHRVAQWLREQLPKRHEIIASPAKRTRQTAEALGGPVRIDPRLGPEADVAHYLAASDWPQGSAQACGTLVLVGHQPILGRLASLLLCGVEHNWSVRKGAVWWISTREREDRAQTVLRAVIAAELLGETR